MMDEKDSKNVNGEENIDKVENHNESEKKKGTRPGRKKRSVDRSDNLSSTPVKKRTPRRRAIAETLSFPATMDEIRDILRRDVFDNGG